MTDDDPPVLRSHHLSAMAVIAGKRQKVPEMIFCYGGYLLSDMKYLKIALVLPEVDNLLEDW